MNISLRKPLISALAVTLAFAGSAMADGANKDEAVTMVKKAVAFGMEVKLRGREVKDFPEFPAAWLEAAKRSKTKVLVIPPDELFKLIWAD